MNKLGSRPPDSRERPSDLGDLLEAIPVGVHWIGPDGVLLRVNPAELKLLGYAREEYVGRPIGAFHVDPEVAEAILARFRAGEALRDCEARMRCRDGGIKHVLLEGQGEWADGQLVQARCFMRDISGQKQAEQLLRFFTEGEADYTCVARWDGRDLEIEAASDGFTRVTGYAVEEFNARLAALVLYPEDIPVVLQDAERLFIGEPVRHEARIIRKDGAVRWLRYMAQPLSAAGDPRFLRIYGAAQDITERKQGVERVYEAERRFREMAESIREVFWLTDPWRTRVFYCSPAYEAIWGRSRESFAQQPWSLFDSVVPEDRERFVAALESQSRGEATDVEYRILRPDGSVRWIRDRSFPVRDAAGAVARVAGVADDVTERANLLAELRAADRRKDEFLATLAHELRNPLAPICNAVELLKQKLLPGSSSAAGDDDRLETEYGTRETLSVIDRQVQQMARLVDDLLDVSRISQGKITLRKETIELGAVVRGALEASRLLIEQSRHQLTVSLPPAPVYLEADPARLAQVLTNLLNNAAKYTPPGGQIGLTAAVEAGSGVVDLRIRDSGIGISREMLPRIFEMFTQADRSLESAKGGLGIGLTLVRQLVELHGGAIQAFSAGSGQGSEFVLRLPVALLQGSGVGGQGSVPTPDGSVLTPDPSPLTPDLPAPERRILVVDDNRDALETMAELLAALGHEVQTAADGLEAIGTAARFQPHVILLDIGLPKLNGYEVARRIRQELGTAVVIIALSGWGQEEDRRRSREAGFDHHLTKPVDLEALQPLLVG